ncbi:hypothetical protein [Azospirillum halopraeferens]|uniref:hypothetical protein n=1 Tax=Azospirillum halopraeferens TaxID=34010 RepID=UPI00041B383D|nr:hypothetical protein [Azospirillum halopraeferens]
MAAAGHKDHGPLRLTIAIVGVLTTLSLLGYGGVIAVNRFVEHRQVVARMGPKPPTASLPAWEFALSGHRSLDLKVSLELAPRTDPGFVTGAVERIGDRLYDDIRDLDMEGLIGPGSAERVKDSVSRAVRRETGRDVVRAVRIEQMVVK